MKAEDTSRFRLRFWEQLLEKSNSKTDLFLGVSPKEVAWIEKAVSKEKIGVSGIAYEYVMSLRPVETRVQLKIDVGSEEKNKRIYDIFHSQYREIEKDFGAILCWLRRDYSTYSRIAYVVTKNGLKDKKLWNDTQSKMVDAMINLEQALSKHYGKIKRLFI